MASLVSSFELALDAEGQDARVQDSFFQRGLDEGALAAHRNVDEQLYPAASPWSRTAVLLGGLGLVTVLVLAALGTRGTANEVPAAEQEPAAETRVAASLPDSPSHTAAGAAAAPEGEPVSDFKSQTTLEEARSAISPVSAGGGAVRGGGAEEVSPGRAALMSYQAIGTKLEEEDEPGAGSRNIATAPGDAVPAERGALSASASAGAVATASGVFDADLRSTCERAYAQHRFRDVLDRCGSVVPSDPDATLDPKDAPLAALVAHAYFMHGKLREASTSAARIIDVVPTHAFAYVVLGMAEQERGRRDRARAAYQRYLELDPQGEYAKDLRAILRRL